MSKPKKLAIVSCILDDWGGSEELWARSIPLLKQYGVNEITVYKNKLNLKHPEFVKLKQNGIKFKELIPTVTPLKKIFKKTIYVFHRVLDKVGLLTYNWNTAGENLRKYLKIDRPDLTIISQGINFDGLALAYQCLQLNIPYIVISHKAVDFYWPPASERAYMRETLLKAKECLFVSEHNKTLTEEQFGVRLQKSKIVLNPVKTIARILPYPNTDNGYRLACIGRIFVIDKGHDILFKVLSLQKWRDRNISISVFGSGPDLDALTDLVALLNLKSVIFEGHKGNIEDIWQNHHALILPSRSEGLPLTIIEAMAFGRTVITTNAGGNAEVVQHNVTGFIGEANLKDLDEAMETAWQKRNEWEQIGIKAASYIKETIPPMPEQHFVNMITTILNEQ